MGLEVSTQRAGVWALMWLFLIVGTAQAETIRYVTDDLTIPMRSGKSTQHKILRFIPSGTPLTVLEVSEADGYTRVRTGQGNEGWVQSVKLMDGPGAQARLAQAKQRVEQLKLEQQTQQEKLQQVSAELAQQHQQGAELAAQLEQANKELAQLRSVAAEPIQVAKQNTLLKTQLAQTQTLNQDLRLENKGLRDTSLKQWFLIGGGVALGSLFLGLIIPRIPWRRRRWDDFH